MEDVISLSGRDIFALRCSVRQSEFFAASTQGITPDMMFRIRTAEYNGEDTLVYNHRRYVIYRTYTDNRDWIELYCTVRVGVR